MWDQRYDTLVFVCRIAVFLSNTDRHNAEVTEMWCSIIGAEVYTGKVSLDVNLFFFFLPENNYFDTELCILYMGLLCYRFSWGGGYCLFCVFFCRDYVQFIIVTCTLHFITWTVIHAVLHILVFPKVLLQTGISKGPHQ